MVGIPYGIQTYTGWGKEDPCVRSMRAGPWAGGGDGVDRVLLRRHLVTCLHYPVLCRDPNLWTVKCKVCVLASGCCNGGPFIFSESSGEASLLIPL